MLFDLRSRGRRRTVQGVYLFLAVLIGGGLVLFGVGAGNGLGGLLNGITGNGSNSGQQSAVSQQEKNAIKATQRNPTSAAAWANLVQARWSTARSNSADIDANTGQFTAAGKKELTKATQAWQRYLALTKSPSNDLSIVAANAYAAHNTRTGDLASAKALSLVPKAQRTLLKSNIDKAKTDPTVAQSC